MSTLVLIQLFLAHILSDFILQTDLINNGKRGFRKKNQSEIQQLPKTSQYGYQLLHSFTHAFTSYLLIGQFGHWLLPLLIFTTHFILDYIKSSYLKENTTTFIVDQLLHLSSLIIIWLLLFNQLPFFIDWWNTLTTSTAFWSILTAYLLVLKPSSILLNLFISKWTPTELSKETLPNAGKWIGYLERTLILTFILTNTLEGIGFLLAAKSIFRFGELNKAKEIKITEYVLIGTLASFTIALIIGLSLCQQPIKTLF